MGKESRNKIPEAFVALRKSIILSEAYFKLSAHAAKLLNYFLFKGGIEKSKGELAFNFPYTQAEKYGFSRRTFHRCVKELIQAGYITKAPGGLAGPGGKACAYSLSNEWMKSLRPKVPKYFAAPNG